MVPSEAQIWAKSLGRVKEIGSDTRLTKLLMELMKKRLADLKR